MAKKKRPSREELFTPEELERYERTQAMLKAQLERVLKRDAERRAARGEG